MSFSRTGPGVERPGISNPDFLDEKETLAVRQLAERLTRQVISVGDSQLRAMADADNQLINKGRTQAQEDPSNIPNVLGDLRAIIGGGPSHPLLSKVYAVIAYCDISVASGHWDEDFQNFFTDAAQTEPEPGGRLVLTGAFYARLASHFAQRPDGHKLLKTLDEELDLQVNTAKKQRDRLAINVSARVIADMIDEDSLRMRMPEAVISSSDGSRVESKSQGGGYPDSIMYLGEGRYPTGEKLDEAARIGVPHVSNELLVRRIPRVLAGVEVLARNGIQARTPNLDRHPDKKLVHVHQRGLIKPEFAAEAAFSSEFYYNGSEVLKYVSFDSLSLFEAIKASRDLQKIFSKVQTKYPGETNSEINERQRRAAFKRIDRLVDDISKPIGRDEKGDISILSVALRESQLYDGTDEWGMQEAQNHIRYTVRALALRNSNGRLYVRTPDEILQLYKTHIWETVLSDKDKAELASAMIMDSLARNKESVLWRNIPDNLQQKVSQYLHGNIPLDREIILALSAALEFHKDRAFVVRCETIRDKISPEASEN